MHLRRESAQVVKDPVLPRGLTMGEAWADEMVDLGSPAY